MNVLTKRLKIRGSLAAVPARYCMRENSKQFLPVLSLTKKDNER